MAMLNATRFHGFLPGAMRAGAPSAPGAGAQRVRLFIASVMTLVAGAAFLAVGESFLNDPDTLWHVTVGADIWASKSFPHVDAYSHSFAGAPWIAKEWLSQMILFAAYSAGGWNGVALLSISVLTIVFLQIYWPLSAQVKPVYAALATFVVFGLTSEVFLARPHLLVLPVLLWFVGGVWRAGAAGRAPSFWLLAAMGLWANLHGSFTFGFVAAALSFLAFFIAHRRVWSRETYRWLGFLALCPLAAMIHPYGYEAIWSTIVIAKSEALPYIMEWRAFSAQEDVLVELALLALFAGALTGRVRLKPVSIVFLCLLLHMYFTHVRFMYLLFMLAPIIGIAELAKELPAISFARWARRVENDRIEQAMARLAPQALIASAGLLVAAFAAAVSLADWSPQRSYPAAAIAAARAQGVQGNVINDYSFGGALIYERIPTFVDGRADRLFQDGFMHDIHESGLAGGEGVIRMQIEKYGIGWSLYPPADKRVVLLDKMEGWRRIYEDDFAVVHAAAGTVR